MKIFNGRGILRGSVDYSSILAWLNSSAFAFGGFTPAFELDFVGNPKTAQENLTHERAGNAMMRDAQGRWVWAPHNLLTWSEDFTKASWNKVSGSSVESNVALAPDGTMTADRLNLSTDPQSRVEQALSGLPVTDWALGVWLRSESGTVNIRIRNSATDFTDFAVGVEWTYYEHNCTEIDSNVFYGIMNTSGTAKSVLAWGARVYRSDFPMADNPATGNSYVPTTDAPVYLPRIGHHEWNGSEWVNKGLLKEGQATNLIPNSATFDLNDGTWTSVGVIGKNGTTTGPNGDTVDVWKLGGAQAFYTDLPYPSGVAGVSSVWIKASEPATLGLRAAGTSFEDNTPIDVTTEWKRFYATGISPDANGFRFLIDGRVANGYGLEGGVDLAIWLPQLELGSLPSSPIPTNGSAVTRAADVMTQPAGTLPWPTPEVIGPELVVNGTFDTDTDWVEGDNWSISDGVAIGSGVSGTRLGYPISVTEGKLYLVQYEIKSVSAGYVRAEFTGGSGVLGTLVTNIGTHTELFRANAGNDTLTFYGAVAFSGAIDNVSVREINPLALTIGMAGEVSYSDNSVSQEAIFLNWYLNASEKIVWDMTTITTRTGQPYFKQTASATSSNLAASATALAPDLNVPFAFCATHASTFVAAAVNGVALTTNTTPTALPDLSATEVELLPTFNGTVKWIAYWTKDIGSTGRLEGSSNG